LTLSFALQSAKCKAVSII